MKFNRVPTVALNCFTGVTMSLETLMTTIENEQWKIKFKGLHTPILFAERWKAYKVNTQCLSKGILEFL